jgi:hypothetical protein
LTQATEGCPSTRQLGVAIDPDDRGLPFDPTARHYIEQSLDYNVHYVWNTVNTQEIQHNLDKFRHLNFHVYIYTL